MARIFSNFNRVAVDFFNAGKAELRSVSRQVTGRARIQIREVLPFEIRSKNKANPPSQSASYDSPQLSLEEFKSWANQDCYEVLGTQKENSWLETLEKYRIKSSPTGSGDTPAPPQFILDAALKRWANEQGWQIVFDFETNEIDQKKLERLEKIYSKVMTRQKKLNAKRNITNPEIREDCKINSLVELDEAIEKAGGINISKEEEKILINTYLKTNSSAQIKIEGEVLEKAAKDISAVIDAIELLKAGQQGMSPASAGIDVEMDIKDIKWENIRNTARENSKALENQYDERQEKESDETVKSRLKSEKENALKNLNSAYKTLYAFYKPSDDEKLGFSKDDSKLLDEIVKLEPQLVLEADRESVKGLLSEAKKKIGEHISIAFTFKKFHQATAGWPDPQRKEFRDALDELLSNIEAVDFAKLKEYLDKAESQQSSTSSSNKS